MNASKFSLISLEQKQLDAAYGRLRDQRIKPVMETGYFQRHYESEQADVIEWRWNCTFGRWNALVQFGDGEQLCTYPV